MSQYTFSQGDQYPDLFDTVKWNGNVPTDNITGIMIANGSDSGPFTGALTPVSNVTDPALSTWSWQFDVTEADTAEIGTYRLCLRLTHGDGDQETVDLDCRVEVQECG